MKKCKELSNRFLEANIINKEEMEICCFGLECLFLKIITFASYLVIAIIMKRLKEFVVIMLIFIPLRRNAGGYHAKTRGKCYLLSCGILIVTLIACEIRLELYIVLTLLIGLSIIFWMTLPVDNENRIMDISEKIFFQARVRKIILLNSMFCIILIFLKLEETCKTVVLGMLMALFFLFAGKIQVKFKSFIKNC